jgi:hypothetical protein
MRALWQRRTPPAKIPSRRPPKSFRPDLQILEDRLTPATFFVTNPADNLLPGSLRYAITQANLPAIRVPPWRSPRNASGPSPFREGNYPLPPA